MNLKIDNTGFARPPKPQPDAPLGVDAAYRGLVEDALRPKKRKKKRSSISFQHSGSRVQSSNSTNLEEFMEKQQYARRHSVPRPMVSEYGRSIVPLAVPSDRNAL